MERIKRDVLKLVERIKTEDKEHIKSLFDGYMFMVTYIKGDLKWMNEVKYLFEKF